MMIVMVGMPIVALVIFNCSKSALLLAVEMMLGAGTKIIKKCKTFLFCFILDNF